METWMAWNLYNLFYNFYNGFEESDESLLTKSKDLNILQILQRFTMADVTISLRVDKALHEQMKFHDEINWSAVLRKTITEQIENLEKIDYERAKEAAHSIDKLRMSGIFSKGKSSVEIIRAWRQKRK